MRVGEGCWSESARISEKMCHKCIFYDDPEVCYQWVFYGIERVFYGIERVCYNTYLVYEYVVR